MFGWQYIGQINEIRKREKTINSIADYEKPIK